MPDIKLGSLFDGIGVFPLAASRCGIRPVWASEIEKAPISITKRHFPDMAHLGDITKADYYYMEALLRLKRLTENKPVIDE